MNHQHAFYVRKRAPAEWLSYPLLRRGLITIVTAPAGTGKSQLLIAQAFRAALGQDLFGSERGPTNHTVYLALDGPPDDYQYLTSCHSAGMDLAWPSLTWDHELVPYDPRPAILHDNLPLYFSFDKVKGSNRNVVHLANHTFTPGYDPEREEAPATSNPSVVLIDCFSHIHRGNINDDKDVVETMLLLRQIADTGAAVLVAHHPAKLTEGKAAVNFSKGSSEIVNMPDVVINLRYKSLTRTSKLMTLHFAKGRGPDLPEHLSYVLEWKPDQPWARVREPDEHDDDPAVQLKGQLKPGKQYHWNELQKLCPVSPSRLKDLLPAAGLIKLAPNVWVFQEDGKLKND